MFPFVPTNHHLIRPSSSNSHGSNNSERNFWSVWTGGSECSSNKPKKILQKLNSKSQRVLDPIKSSVSDVVGCYASVFITKDTKSKSIGTLDVYSTSNESKRINLSTRGYLQTEDKVPEHIWIKHLRNSMDTHSNNVILEFVNDELIIRTIRNINTNEEILLWFSEEILAAMYIPFLTPANIRGKYPTMNTEHTNACAFYVCVLCGCICFCLCMLF